MRSAALTLFGLLTWPLVANAQGAVQGPAPSVLFGYRHAGPVYATVAAGPRDSLRRQIPPTYWKEGAVTGGVLGAVGGALLAHRLCGLAEESTEHCTGSLALGGVLGAALLAIPGALIGGQFSRGPADHEHPD